MADLVINNDEHLFSYLNRKQTQADSSSYQYTMHDVLIGYRTAFFNLLTLDTQTSYIAFSEREELNKNHGRFDFYFLFRTLVPDGIILYRYAQGLNEYFAIGLRAGIITLIELIVDNRVNLSTLSTNGIRAAVSLQPVLYIGGIPNRNINLTGSGLNSHGFQGCLASFIVEGTVLDYSSALALNGKVKMNVCSADEFDNEEEDLNKLCYDFTCVHHGYCTTANDRPICDCLETAYTGEKCEQYPKGFYFGKNNGQGSLVYKNYPRTTDKDTIVFGLQTLSNTAQIL
ncbi:unnamed protein product, partial [Didymodactylos carnosus]